MSTPLRSVLIGVGAGAAVLAVVLVVRGGGDETVFTAEEFVAQANQAGAGIVLRESLELFSEETESHAISFLAAGGGGAAPAAGGAADRAHGAATLVVSEDSDAALETYRRCMGAVTLTCFRAANVALQVESATPEELARLEAAFLALREPG